MHYYYIYSRVSVYILQTKHIIIIKDKNFNNRLYYKSAEINNIVEFI